jgi:hypothetical protein
VAESEKIIVFDFFGDFPENRIFQKIDFFEGKLEKNMRKNRMFHVADGENSGK